MNVLMNLFSDPIETHETVCSCSDDGTTASQTLGRGEEKGGGRVRRDREKE